MSDYKFIPDENFDVDNKDKVFDTVRLQGGTFSLTEKGEIIVLLPTEGGCCAETYSLTKMLNWVGGNKPEWLKCCATDGMMPKSCRHPPPKPPGPPGRTYKDYPLIGLVETKASKLIRVKYEAFMEGYSFALNRGSILP